MNSLECPPRTNFIYTEIKCFKLSKSIRCRWT